MAAAYMYADNSNTCRQALLAQLVNVNQKHQLNPITFAQQLAWTWRLLLASFQVCATSQNVHCCLCIPAAQQANFTITNKPWRQPIASLSDKYRRNPLESAGRRSTCHLQAFPGSHPAHGPQICAYQQPTLTMRTLRLPSCPGGSCSVFSICTTASAPSGTGPPAAGRRLIVDVWANRKGTRTLPDVPALSSTSCMPLHPMWKLRAASVVQQAVHLFAHTYSCCDSSAQPHQSWLQRLAAAGVSSRNCSCFVRTWP